MNKLEYYLEDIFPDSTRLSLKPVVTLNDVDDLYVEYLSSNKRFASKEERNGFEKGVAEMLKYLKEYDEDMLEDFYKCDDNYYAFLKEAYLDEAIDQYRKDYDDE